MSKETYRVIDSQSVFVVKQGKEDMHRFLTSKCPRRLIWEKTMSSDEPSCFGFGVGASVSETCPNFKGLSINDTGQFCVLCNK
jgi:hypothetical protein